VTEVVVDLKWVDRNDNLRALSIDYDLQPYWLSHWLCHDCLVKHYKDILRHVFKIYVNVLISHLALSRWPKIVMTCIPSLELYYYPIELATIT